MKRFVTFTIWVSPSQAADPAYKPRHATINPDEVSDVVDYCGDVKPGSVMTMKNKQSFLVEGDHSWIVATLEAARSAA